MGKAGRIACIFTPYAFSIASLICLVLVGLGCTNKSSSTLNDLYFFRANLQNLTSSPEVSSDLMKLADLDKNLSGNLTTLLNQAEEDLNLKDFYVVGLWNYCDGNVTHGDDYETTYCAKGKAAFWFNPVEVWKLNGTGVEDLFPESLQKGLKVYKDVSKWMFIAYVIAFFATIIEIVVGVFAICSRWGSFVTSLISGVSLLFTIAASVTSTVLFSILTGTFNKALKSYGIHGNMGKNIYVTTWLAVAFSLGASLFWLLSSCCCSGKSPYHQDRKNKRVTVEKAPYTYERVGSPYGHMGNQQTPVSYGGPNVPMQPMRTNAYEPFRHV